MNLYGACCRLVGAKEMPIGGRDNGAAIRRDGLSRQAGIGCDRPFKSLLSLPANNIYQRKIGLHLF